VARRARNSIAVTAFLGSRRFELAPMGLALALRPHKTAPDEETETPRQLLFFYNINLFHLINKLSEEFASY